MDKNKDIEVIRRIKRKLHHTGKEFKIRKLLHSLINISSFISYSNFKHLIAECAIFPL